MATPLDANANTASDAHSTVFDEKPNQQPSILSSTSVESARIPVADQIHVQGNDDHVIEKDGTVLEPVQSRRSSGRDVSKIPNGGLMAWLQVLGAFFLLFNSWYEMQTSNSVIEVADLNSGASSTLSDHIRPTTKLIF